MLNSEETLKYLRLAKSGDNNAKETLLINNSGLVKSIAKKFTNKGVEFDDLYQLACIGFLKAINNFKEGFEVKFTTYAVPMIIGEIKRFLRDDGAIKVSRMIKMQAMQINRYIESYKNENGYEPKISDIAIKFNISQEDVIFALDSNKMPISIYEDSDNGNEKTPSLIDKIQSEFDEDKLLDKIMFSSLIEKLPDREKKLIIMRFYRDKTQSETAKILGISQVQVSRLETKILEKFKNAI